MELLPIKVVDSVLFACEFPKKNLNSGPVLEDKVSFRKLLCRVLIAKAQKKSV